MELVAVATRDEVDGFLDGTEVTDEILGRPVFEPPEEPGGLKVAVTGIGRTNAGAVLSVALERYDVSRVVSAGIGGALPGSSLEVGDTVVGTHAVHADLGVEAPDGFGGTEHLGFETSEGYYNSYPLEDLPIEGDRGGIATVSTVSASEDSADRVAERTDALVETMETASIAQVARLAEVPASAVVGVSNHTGENRDFEFQEGTDALEDGLEEVYRD